MSKLGRSINKLDIDSLKMLPGAVNHQTLTKDKRTLLDSNATSLEHDPVLIDLSVMGETSHGSDTLLGKIIRSLTRRSISLASKTVNSLVHISTVEVSILSSTWNSGGNTSRMPGSNTSDLTKTTMGLTWKTGNSPTVSDSLETLTLGNSNDINILVLCEYRVNSDLLLEKSLCKVNLCSSISSSINLDFHDMCLLHTKVKFLNLCVCDNTYNGTELGNTGKFMLNVLSTISGVLGSILGVSLLLALVPVLVTTTLELIGKMLCEDGGEGTKSMGGLDVSNNSNNDHGWGLKDGDSINDFTLVHDGTRTVNSTNNVGHSSLVSTESGEVGSSRGISVLGEGTDAAEMVLGTLLGGESHVTMAGSFELTVRHVCWLVGCPA
jgi:hypothetical protein